MVVLYADKSDKSADRYGVAWILAETSRQGTQNTVEYDYINSVDGKGAWREMIVANVPQLLSLCIVCIGLGVLIGFGIGVHERKK